MKNPPQIEVNQIEINKGDALLIVDVQNDFLPDGNLAVPLGNEVVAVLNLYIEAFQTLGLPVFATRDWHPKDHCSFQDQGGIWPPHCIAQTEGAQFAPALRLPAQVIIITKADTVEKDAYSGFEGTDLTDRLHREGVTRVFVGGLATDFCVLSTVKDALAQGFIVVLLQDATRAVNVQVGDGERATLEMVKLGAQPIEHDSIR